MERMTDDAAKKRRELEHELTLTMTAQVQGHKQSRRNFCLITSDFVTNTVVEALVSGHPRDNKKVSVTDCLRECKNTEFVWGLRKMGICEGGRLLSCLLTRVSVRKASTVVMVSPGTHLVKNLNVCVFRLSQTRRLRSSAKHMVSDKNCYGSGRILLNRCKREIEKWTNWLWYVYDMALIPKIDFCGQFFLPVSGNPAKLRQQLQCDWRFLFLNGFSTFRGRSL